RLVDWGHARRTPPRRRRPHPAGAAPLPHLRDRDRRLPAAARAHDGVPLRVRVGHRTRRPVRAPHAAAARAHRRRQPVDDHPHRPRLALRRLPRARLPALAARALQLPAVLLHRPRRDHPGAVVLLRGEGAQARGGATPRRGAGGGGRVSVDQPTEQRPVLVVDFGAQYAQLIARRVREAGVYSEIVPHTVGAEEIRAKNPVGIVLSGGPSSVYEEGSPSLDPAVLELGVPTLGICYGFQVMAQQLGGEVAKTGSREYGSTAVRLVGDGGGLLAGQPAEQIAWMSHGDSVVRAPDGFEVLASSEGTPVAAFAN